MSLTSLILGASNRRVSAVAKRLARIAYYIQRRDYWHFAAVYVETVQHCNRRCHYCPQSIYPLPKATMTDDDFGTVLRRLQDHDWRGPVYLNRFGEPLLDPNLSSRIERLARLTDHVQLFSNGDLLTPAKAIELVTAGLELCKITRHPPVRPDFDGRIADVISIYPKHFKLLDPVEPDTIGGLNPEAPNYTACTLPSWAFIINPNLDVSLCCHDYNRDHVFGNLRKQSIHEIWNSTIFKDIRRRLRAGIFDYPICRACAGVPNYRDSIRTKMENLHAARQQSPASSDYRDLV